MDFPKNIKTGDKFVLPLEGFKSVLGGEPQWQSSKPVQKTGSPPLPKDSVTLGPDHKKRLDNILQKK